MYFLFLSVNALDLFNRDVPVVNAKQFYTYAQDKLLADHCVKWANIIENKPKLHYYKMIKNEFKVENYCVVGVKRSQRSHIAKLRLGILPINVELGRYQRKPREECLCELCDQKVVEDELHILFHCTAHNTGRQFLLEHAVRIDPMICDVCDTDKMKILTTNPNIIRKTAHYINEVIATRNNKLNIQ